MALSDEKIRSYIQRLLLSRMRIICANGFYGLLLMHMRYGIDESCSTAATDGERIFFGPQFLEDLSDGELDFVMMHEIMHVVLQHCFRGQDKDDELFNIACDIVVNSNILLSNDMDLKSIRLRKYGEAMHLAPNGEEGHKYTATEVYDMLSKEVGALNGGKPDMTDGATASGKGADGDQWDDHSQWGTIEEDSVLKDTWRKRVLDACEAVEIRNACQGCGANLPAFARRLLQELRAPQTDWRTILNEFIQEEVVDYSFSPPDKRYDGPFFLPDFNEKEETVENILFMIDTSGSMTDRMITAAYSEVKGAIDQFGGKLKGLLGFFDEDIVEPQPFEDEEEFRIIKPMGGGGTNFAIIFEYVKRFMPTPPASIIILTDGEAPFPKEEAAGGVPVLWLLNNEIVQPPWGMVARITLKE